MSINLSALPAQLGELQGRQQAHATDKLRKRMKKNDQLLHEHLYPLLHECSSILNPSEQKSQYDLSSFSEKFSLDEIERLYRDYRREIMEESANNNLQDGVLHELFPENLSEVSPHELGKIEFRIKNWIDNCKSMNNRAMQDLYFLVQIGVVLLSCFQNIQKEANQAGEHIVRNQR